MFNFLGARDRNKQAKKATIAQNKAAKRGYKYNKKVRLFNQTKDKLIYTYKGKTTR